MKNLLLFGLVSLFLGMTGMRLPGSQHRDVKEDIRDKFVGGWRLVSLETEGADGKVHHSDSTGLLTFTRDGHMSVHIMERNPQPEAPVGPEQYSQGGYEASFGTYEVEEITHTFNFHVEGGLVRTLIGKDLRRSFEFSGNLLIVKPTRPDEHWRVVWKHY